MAKSHKTCMDQAEIIDTFGTYQEAPKPKEPMLLYLSANKRAVSVVVVVEHMEADKEHPL